MRVTFDSNVYRRVVAPESFPNDPLNTQLDRIHQHLKDKHIQGLLSETVATLEGVIRSNRCSYFSSTKPKVQFTETETPDGSISLQVRAGPDNSQHPGLPEVRGANPGMKRRDSGFEVRFGQDLRWPAERALGQRSVAGARGRGARGHFRHLGCPGGHRGSSRMRCRGGHRSSCG